MKKTISILMALIMIFSVLSVGATALDAAELPIRPNLASAEVIRYVPGQELPTSSASGEAAVNRFASADPNTPYTFYTALTSLQKDIYNGLLKAGKPQEENIINLSKTMTITVWVVDNQLVTPDWFVDEVMTGVYAAASALMDDHPEMFWIGDFSNISFDGPTTANADGSYTVQVNQLLVAYELPEGYASWAAVQTAYTQMLQVADSVQITGANRFEKLKNVHDWIAKRVDYDYSFGPTCFEATSVFLAPYKTVCEGYSEAFKMLCDRAGIPCIVVVGDAGEPHAWNYVKMEDGNWYAVDVTWDDQNYENGDDLIFYDFFLRGANSTEIFFHDEDEAPTAFKTSHKPMGDRYADANGNAIYTLTYPALAEEGYTRMLLAPNSEALVDKASMTVKLPDGTDIVDAFLIPDGYNGYAPSDEPILQVTQVVNGQEVLVEEYKIVVLKAGRLGDVNGDGVINAVDARWALQAASGVRSLTAAQEIAANVNGDDVVNAIDARWILQIASGTRPEPAAA